MVKMGEVDNNDFGIRCGAYFVYNKYNKKYIKTASPLRTLQ